MDFSHYTKEDFLSLYDRPLSELVEIAHGINAILIGNYLTTTGASPTEDKVLLKKLDLQLIS